MNSIKKLFDLKNQPPLLLAANILLIVISFLIIFHLLFGPLKIQGQEKEILLFKMRHLLLIWLTVLSFKVYQTQKSKKQNLRTFITDYKHEIILVVFVLLILFIRMFCIDFGLPHLYDIDESYVVANVLTMMQDGTLNHKNFKYGGIYYYIMFAVFSLYFLLKHAPVLPFAKFHVVPESEFYMLARGVNVVISIIAIILVYYVGKKFRDKNTGLAAAFITGFGLSHFVNSVTVRMDILVAVLCLAAFIFILNIWKEGKFRDYIWASIFIALATGTKFYGLFMVLPLIYAHFFRDYKKKEKKIHNKLGWSFLIIIIAFLITNPFVILDYTTFMKDFSHLIEQILGAKNHWSLQGTTPSHRNMQFLFYNGLGLIAGALFIIFLLKFLIKPQKEVGLLLTFPLIHFFMLSGSKQVHHRFMLALLGFLILFTVVSLQEIIDRLKKIKAKNTVFWIVIAACLIIPIKQTYTVVTDMQKTTTSEIAYDWIKKNIPVDTRFLVQKFTVIPEKKKYKTRYFSKPYQVRANEIIEPGDGYHYVIVKVKKADGRYRFPGGVRQLIDEIKRFVPEEGKTLGPNLIIYRVKPSPAPTVLTTDNWLLDDAGNAKIDIGIEEEDRIYLDSGWGPVKDDARGIFRWISGNDAGIHFKLNPAVKSKKNLKVTFNLHHLEKNKHLLSYLDIETNSKTTKSIKLKSTNSKQKVSISIPFNNLNVGKKPNRVLLKLRYHLPEKYVHFKTIGLRAPKVQVHEILFKLQ